MITPTTQFLDRPDGRLSYDDNGATGPLVIAAPGMGDLRHVYRHIRPELTETSVRLLTMDLRGMGDSSTGWRELDDQAVASDYLALIDHLGGEPAVLVGNSLSCASAVLAATDAPEKVAGMMLLGPFVRDVPMKWWQKAAFGALLMPPWGKRAWVSYYRNNMYPGATPPDFEEYLEQLSANLGQPSRFASFRSISTSSHAESGRRLDRVTQPTVVVMGTADPDFPDPTAEARHIAGIMGADLVLSEGSGHYPQAETPELVARALIDLVERTSNKES